MTQQEMEAIWAEHIRHEFVTRDVEATLATMVEDASVNHVPVTTGGKGKTALRAASRPQVNHLMLDTVEGRRKRLRDRVSVGSASWESSLFRSKARSKIPLISRTA